MMRAKKVSWEIQRHNWDSLRSAGNSSKIPEAILELKDSITSKDAEKAYWKIDNVVIVQGSLYEAAVAVVPCLLGTIYNCTEPARPYILELLEQIGCGEASDVEMEFNNFDISGLCLKELVNGVSAYFYILEHGSSEEQRLCVDLLGLCCEFNRDLVPRVKWWLNKFRSVKKEDNKFFSDLIDNWIKELE